MREVACEFAPINNFSDYQSGPDLPLYSRDLGLI